MQGSALSRAGQIWAGRRTPAPAPLAYERQATGVPNGESDAVAFDLAPDVARFGTRRRPAVVIGAWKFAGLLRPVYHSPAEELQYVLHTEPGEDLRPFGAVVNERGRVTFTAMQWDACRRLGAAFAVRPVMPTPAEAGGSEGRP